MERLSVGAEGATQAPRADVWNLVADANRYPVWGPWRAGGYQPEGPGPSQPGMQQWFRYGRRTTSQERVLEVDDGYRIVYTVEGGIPVKNYRAEILLSETGSGTHVSWQAEWDRTILGRIVLRKLRVIYPEILTCLISYADAACGTRKDAPAWES